MRLNMIITYILACSMGVITFGCSTVGLGKKEDTAKENVTESLDKVKEQTKRFQREIKNQFDKLKSSNKRKCS